jgi:hypothetical protein
VGGSSGSGALGTYGTIGLPSTSNIPGARYGGASWVDVNGDLWLFGGYGYDGTTSGIAFHNFLLVAMMNDLWRYRIISGDWTYMRGSTITAALSTYGLIGVPDPANVPGSRSQAGACADSVGNLWLFHGSGMWSWECISFFSSNSQMLMCGNSTPLSNLPQSPPNHLRPRFSLRYPQRH